MASRFWKLWLAAAGILPGALVHLSGAHVHPVVAMVLYGASIVAASFLLAWGAEVAQLDVSASMATAALALIAVLPEYAVDLYFAYTAGHKPEYAAFAAANMTGSNRLLIGLGWPLVSLLFALAVGRSGISRSVELRTRQRVELGVLSIASVYAFIIPFKRTLSLVDAAVLLGLFGLYLWRVAREEAEEPELHGVSASLGALSPAARRTSVGMMFALAAGAIVIVAKPFAESLIASGRALGVDEFLLVQWLAPLASEAPELLVASILALRREGDVALGTLLSSKVNQWTLLVGSIPIAYTAGGGTGGLPLDARQVEEFVLTASQSVLGLSLLLGLKFGRREALLLLLAFALQPLFTQRDVRLGFAVAYVLIALAVLWMRRRDVLPTLRAVVRDTAG